MAMPNQARAGVRGLTVRAAAVMAVAGVTAALRVAALRIAAQNQPVRQIVRLQAHRERNTGPAAAAQRLAAIPALLLRVTLPVLMHGTAIRSSANTGRIRTFPA